MQKIDLTSKTFHPAFAAREIQLREARSAIKNAPAQYATAKWWKASEIPLMIELLLGKPKTTLQLIDKELKRIDEMKSGATV